MVLGAKTNHDERYRQTLDELIRVYWRPVYVYIRSTWGKTNEDAKDLTQAFFVHLMSRKFFAKVAPEIGRFRTFLKACVKNFVNSSEASEKALKRGGRRIRLSLDLSDAVLPEMSERASPEEAFDREWSKTVMKEALVRLLVTYREENREVYFRVFEAYDLLTDPKPSYKQLADRLGIKETDVTNFLAHARRRLRALAEELIGDTVATEEELRQEYAQVFRGRE